MPLADHRRLAAATEVVKKSSGSARKQPGLQLGVDLLGGIGEGNETLGCSTIWAAKRAYEIFSRDGC